jgi:RNA polymerase sigma factor (sigma-70 family)
MTDSAANDARAIVESTWRSESARLVASVARLVGDVGMAEELTQDAVATALERWPQTGVPDNPGAWLAHAARQHAIDRLRRQDRLRERVAQLGHAAQLRQQDGAYDGTAELAAILDDDGLPDDVLRLIFVAAHPVLPMDSRVALTLRVVAGLTTTEIARAFLVTEATVAQRIVRAKRTLAEKRIPFEVPPAAERARRLATVLGVVYLVFTEGYAATAGEDWARPALCAEALRLGRMLADLAPDEPEAHGLVALMEIQASRLGARVGPAGDPVPLLEQDRDAWDRDAIRRGFEALLRAQALDGAGPYVLQAAIAACHARARTAAETDWSTIATLYQSLERLDNSPVVRLNRGVAVGMAYGPAEGLRLVDALVDEPALRDYHRLPAVRGELLERLGRTAESREEFARASTLARNARERAVLLDRADRVVTDPDT